MTDEKKELPWHRICERKNNVYWGHDERKSTINGRFIPEPEAIRLHGLDEKCKYLEKQVVSSNTLEYLGGRLKKFELAAATIIDLYDSHALDVVATMDKRFAAKIGGIMKLLREAMGEK